MPRLLISLTLAIVFLEAGSYLAGKELQRRSSLFYTAPAITPAEYKDYLERRDVVLGWPAPGVFRPDNLELDGSRKSPAILDDPTPCVSLYGDSFVWGQDVNNEQAWGNRLSENLNCRVSNFGVNGYGTDQAYLRFHHNVQDTAQVVILGHMSENIRRNLNRYRHLLAPPAVYGFKPRFSLNEQGALELTPIPTLSESALLDFTENPERHLQNEYFIPNGPTGLPKLEFPFFLSLLQVFGDYRIGARLRGDPGYVEFYRQEHPSHGLEVTAGIMEAFHQEALRRGQQPFVVLIPNRFDLDNYRETGVWVYQSLIALLGDQEIPFVNLGEGVLEYLVYRQPEELFSYQGLYYGAHYNDEGNRVIADILHRTLLNREYLPYD